MFEGIFSKVTPDFKNSLTSGGSLNSEYSLFLHDKSEEIIEYIQDPNLDDYLNALSLDNNDFILMITHHQLGSYFECFLTEQNSCRLVCQQL